MLNRWCGLDGCTLIKQLAFSLVQKLRSACKVANSSGNVPLRPFPDNPSEARDELLASLLPVLWKPLLLFSQLPLDLGPEVIVQHVEVR